MYTNKMNKVSCELPGQKVRKFMECRYDDVPTVEELAARMNDLGIDFDAPEYAHIMNSDMELVMKLIFVHYSHKRRTMTPEEYDAYMEQQIEELREIDQDQVA